MGSSAFGAPPAPPSPPPYVAPEQDAAPEKDAYQPPPDPWLVPLPIVYAPSAPDAQHESPMKQLPPVQPPAVGLRRAQIFGIPVWILAAGAALWWYTRRRDA